MSLAALGISPHEEQVYRYFLRNPGTDTADIDRTVVERLLELRLLEIGPDGAVTVVGPQAAMERLIERRLDEVSGELRKVTSVLPSLMAEHTTGAPIELVERIEGIEQTQQRIWQASANARDVLSMHPSRSRVDPRVRERVLAELKAGVRHRSIVHRTTLDDPEVAAYFREIHRAGDRHRVIDEPIQLLLIFDRETAFVPIEPGNPAAGALVIRQPGIIVTLIGLFEQAWSRATDLEPDAADPSAVEKQVLDLLDRLGKDEVAARAMGVSVRTFRGHVADLMGRLGAANRFQIGARAKERGWI
ncbi:helix-turn-helix domain-containing protein [Nonomuraea africana]|uniref:DNA-binding CsgD family transcriptional regulator/sugar-specific transcriptional regulator TrmB n=1 Tax=Nonomuraea africana TaxID=46171 RepID=A0ABR9K8I5_9ACTN|nr:helix-turn-helix transcriptional regulator [Nonomuraea africana]MBE1558320.1 DNA-binding CsgD family transcriptional regulator/sugar-specific transcriptional regulator TrmB [Nonomuraea africana]